MPDIIERKVTWGDQYKHYYSTNISGCQMQMDPTPELPGKAYIRFFDQISLLEDRRNLPATDHLFRITPEMYKRVSRGCKSSSKILRNKLIGQHLYNFIMVTEKMENEKGKQEEVVCNVHAYPNSDARESNMAAEINAQLDPAVNSVVQFYPNGNIDIFVFPAQFSIGLSTFITELEKLPTITADTEIIIPGVDGKVHAEVSSIYGTTVTFDCVEYS